MNILESTIAISIFSAAIYGTIEYVDTMATEIQLQHNVLLEQQKTNIQKARSLNFSRSENGHAN
jgi:hypothetical protein